MIRALNPTKCSFFALQYIPCIHLVAVKFGPIRIETFFPFFPNHLKYPVLSDQMCNMRIPEHAMKYKRKTVPSHSSEAEDEESEEDEPEQEFEESDNEECWGDTMSSIPELTASVCVAKCPEILKKQILDIILHIGDDTNDENVFHCRNVGTETDCFKTEVGMVKFCSLILSCYHSFLKFYVYDDDLRTEHSSDMGASILRLLQSIILRALPSSHRLYVRSDRLQKSTKHHGNVVPIVGCEGDLLTVLLMPPYASFSVDEDQTPRNTNRNRPYLREIPIDKILESMEQLVSRGYNFHIGHVIGAWYRQHGSESLMYRDLQCTNVLNEDRPKLKDFLTMSFEETVDETQLKELLDKLVNEHDPSKNARLRRLLYVLKHLVHMGAMTGRTMTKQDAIRQLLMSEKPATRYGVYTKKTSVEEWTILGNSVGNTIKADRIEDLPFVERSIIKEGWGFDSTTSGSDCFNCFDSWMLEINSSSGSKQSEDIEVSAKKRRKSTEVAVKFYHRRSSGVEVRTHYKVDDNADNKKSMQVLVFLREMDQVLQDLSVINAMNGHRGFKGIHKYIGYNLFNPGKFLLPFSMPLPLGTKPPPAATKASPAATKASPAATKASPAATKASPAATKPPAPVSKPPAPVSKPPAPVSKPPAPVSKPPAPVSKPPAPVSKPPAPVSKPPAPVSKPPAPVSKPPAPVSKPPAPVSKPPAPVSRPPAPVSKPPAPVSKPPAPVSKPPAPVTKPPAPVTKPPAPMTKPPAPVTRPPALVTRPPTPVTRPPPLGTKPPPPDTSRVEQNRKRPLISPASNTSGPVSSSNSDGSKLSEDIIGGEQSKRRCIQLYDVLGRIRCPDESESNSDVCASNTDKVTNDTGSCAPIKRRLTINVNNMQPVDGLEEFSFGQTSDLTPSRWNIPQLSARNENATYFENSTNVKVTTMPKETILEKLIERFRCRIARKFAKADELKKCLNEAHVKVDDNTCINSTIADWHSHKEGVLEAKVSLLNSEIEICIQGPHGLVLSKYNESLNPVTGKSKSKWDQRFCDGQETLSVDVKDYHEENDILKRRKVLKILIDNDPGQTMSWEASKHPKPTDRYDWHEMDMLLSVRTPLSWESNFTTCISCAVSGRLYSRYASLLTTIITNMEQRGNQMRKFGGMDGGITQREMNVASVEIQRVSSECSDVDVLLGLDWDGTLSQFSTIPDENICEDICRECSNILQDTQETACSRFLRSSAQDLLEYIEINAATPVRQLSLTVNQRRRVWNLVSEVWLGGQARCRQIGIWLKKLMCLRHVRLFIISSNHILDSKQTGQGQRVIINMLEYCVGEELVSKIRIQYCKPSLRKIQALGRI